MLNGLVRFARAVRAATKTFTSLQTVEHRSGWWPITGSGGWWPVVRESYAGAWQRNDELRVQNILTYAPVYACTRLISSDVAKMRLKLVRLDKDDVWVETTNTAFSPVIRKPNRYQNRIQFYQHWLTSKLIHGNTYVLKLRNDRGGPERGNVIGMYVLDPTRIKPLVAPDGSVFYGLVADNLAGLTEEDVAMAFPASEIIHDVMCPLYHPLCGVSPISACAIAALLGLKIQSDSLNFFANSAQPSGILSAPGFIQPDTAKRLKEHWDENFTGENAGKVAVLGDGLKFEALRQNARDAQLIEQLKWTADDVCVAFGVPPFKINVGPTPPYNNVEALNQQYYSDCLQVLIETIELLLDEGLGLAVEGKTQEFGTEFEIDDLLRMDSPTRVKAAADSVGGGGMTINEARKKYHGLGKQAGGDAVYVQQQNFSIQALAERDADKPFAKPTEPTKPVEPKTDDEDDDAFDDEMKSLAYLACLRKDLGLESRV